MYFNKDNTTLQAANLIYWYNNEGYLMGQIRKEVKVHEDPMRQVYVHDIDKKAVEYVSLNILHYDKLDKLIIQGIDLDDGYYKEREYLPTLIERRAPAKNTRNIYVQLYLEFLDFTGRYDPFSYAIRRGGVAADPMRLQELIIENGRPKYIAPTIALKPFIDFDGIRYERNDGRGIKSIDYYKTEINDIDTPRYTLHPHSKEFYEWEERNEAYRFIKKF